MSDMSKEAMEVRNAYARAWRKNNPDKARAAQHRYWEKKAREMIEKRDICEQTNDNIKGE